MDLPDLKSKDIRDLIDNATKTNSELVETPLHYVWESLYRALARAEKAEAEVARLKEQVATVLRWQERSSVVQDLKRALARAEKAEARLKDVQDIVSTWDEHNAEQVLYTLDTLLDDAP